MDLWEREGALVGLEAELKRSAAGGRVALVAGEAGIGKSSVVTELVRRVATSARVLWGACDQLVTPRALGPLHDIGRTTGGPLAARLAGSTEPQQVYDAFLDELANREQRLRPLVVVEDAHWADEATLDWLTFTSRRIGRLPVLLVVTYRDDEVGPDHPLRRVLAAMPSDVVTRVALAPLSEERVLEEAARAGRDPRLVRRLAGGNPLLVTELLKDSGGNNAPTGVADLILERLRLLPAPARDLAHLVSVVPTRAEAELVAAVREGTGADDSAPADAAIAGGVLVASGDGLAYRHEVLRRAVEDSLSPTRRAAMHARVLAALEGGALGPEVDPGRLVHHARLSGDGDAVLRHAVVAGKEASRQGAHRESAEHYTAALAHAARLGDAEQARLHEKAAFQCYLVGRFAESLESWRQATALRRRTGDDEAVGNDLRWEGRLLWWVGDTDAALAVSTQAIEVLEALPPSAALGRAYAQHARLFLTAHEGPASVRFARLSCDLAEEFGDTETRLQSGITLALGQTIGGQEATAFPELERLHAEADAAGFYEVASRAVLNPAIMTPDELGEYGPVADERLDAAERYIRAHDMDGFLDHVNGSRSRVLFERGDWAEATACADRVLASPGVPRMNAVLPLVTKARIATARGLPEADELLGAAAAAVAGIHQVAMQAPVADALAELHVWRGESDQARDVLRAALAHTDPAVGNPVIVGRLAWRLHQAGDTGPLPAATAAPFRDMVEGRWAEAAAEWDRRGATYLRAMALVEGDEAAAAEGLRVLDGLGAVKPAEHARAAMRARGMTRVPRGPRRSTARNAAGLTEREAEVLGLVAEGLTNAEISRRLTLSPKTVGHHISAILAKLGVSSRGQAAAAAHRLDLVP